MTRHRQARGFTLVEVLVALIIVAFGMGALMATLSSAADAVGYLREKSLAEWIALNRITEVRLKAGARSVGVPSDINVGKTSGDVEFAGGKWHWQQEIVDPKIPSILRIDVQVQRAAEGGKQRDAWLATASGIIGSSVAASSSVSPDWDGTQSPPPSGGGGAAGTSDGTTQTGTPVPPAAGESAR